MRRTSCPAEESKGGAPRAVRDIILGRMAVDRSNVARAVFSGTVFPRLLLEMRASRYPIADRGIGKFNLKNGISVLYEPSRSEREYLCSYQVCRRNDRTVCFLGCWQKAVFTARYTLLCFNSLGRPIAFYRISEKFIGGRRYTRTVPLPYATAYVGFSLERADGKRIGRAFSPSPVLFDLAEPLSRRFGGARRLFILSCRSFFRGGLSYRIGSSARKHFDGDLLRYRFLAARRRGGADAFRAAPRPFAAPKVSERGRGLLP